MATSLLDIEYYPFDPTGTAATNSIKKESQVLTAGNFRDYHYLIPRFAPFFETSLVVRHRRLNGTTRVLTRGVDYYTANKFRDASLACAREIYGSISFLDTNLAGVIEIDYQTIGGIWNITEEKISEILSEELRNPRIIAWEQIVDLPARFPIIDHEWDLADMTGMKDVKVAVDEVAAAILQAAGGSTQQHINDYNNPHKVTKDQVGLNLVMNYGIATTQQAIDGTLNTVYMTPQRTAVAIQALAGSLVNVHANRTDNPHNTTKAQVGLNLVENYRVATNQEAIDGTLAQAYMTPALTRAAINAQQGNFLDHIANINNPHGTTKAQVGLSLVANYPIATIVEAEAAVRNDRYLTPYSGKALVQQYVTVELDAHAQRTDNPHQTDKDQVGLGNVMNYEMASDQDMTAGHATDKYVNPYGVRKKIEDYVPALIAVHTEDMDNPHGTTASQVGAYSRIEIDTQLANYVRKGEQVGDAEKWGGESHTSYRDWLMDNMPDFNALKFNGMTYSQVVEDILRSVDGGFLQSDHYDGASALTTIPFATLQRIRQNSMDDNSPVTSLDRVFFIVGGNKRADGTNVPSSTTLVYMSVRQNKDELPTMKAYPMPGSTMPSAMRLGYVWDPVNESMIGCVIVEGPSDILNVVDLAGQVPNNDPVPARMLGIPPSVIEILVTDLPGGAGPSGPEWDSLVGRVTALEELLTSITVVK